LSVQLWLTVRPFVDRSCGERHRRRKKKLS